MFAFYPICKSDLDRLCSCKVVGLVNLVGVFNTGLVLGSYAFFEIPVALDVSKDTRRDLPPRLVFFNGP